MIRYQFIQWLRRLFPTQLQAEQDHQKYDCTTDTAGIQFLIAGGSWKPVTILHTHIKVDKASPKTTLTGMKHYLPIAVGHELCRSFPTGSPAGYHRYTYPGTSEYLTISVRLRSTGDKVPY
jgi:hypothetical protein